MLPVPFEVVPSAVNTLLPTFLQVLKSADECLFRNACELHLRSRLNRLDSHVAVLLACATQTLAPEIKLHRRLAQLHT
jgi:hypothetical protein